MRRRVGCDCGAAFEGVREDALVRDAQRHALEVHGIRLSTEFVLALARPVEATAGEEQQ